MTWSAFHASLMEEAHIVPALTALLPLYYENAHSAAMIKHAMELSIKLTAFLNPHQTPTLTADQPLFALGKQIQWNWPVDLGEDKLLMMFGGLHIEMSLLKVSLYHFYWEGM